MKSGMSGGVSTHALNVLTEDAVEAAFAGAGAGVVARASLSLSAVRNIGDRCRWRRRRDRGLDCKVGSKQSGK